MTALTPLSPEMSDLLESLCLDELTPDEAKRLEALVLADDECCEHYVVFLHMHALAERFQGADALREAKPLEERLSAPAPYSVLRTPYSSLSALLPATPLGNVAFSYAMSAVLVAVGLWVFSLMSASSPRDAVVKYNPANSQNYTKPNQPARALEPEIVSIARITGMLDCVWVNENEAPFHNKIKLHDKFALKSGLLEITYHTGARVILQGPCTYEAESTTGGYLSLGKLTARVESRSRLPDGTSRFRLPRGTLPTDHDDAKKSRPAGGTYFAVRTPTATVTDLGTEFGVEVGKAGETDTMVFVGSVRLVGRGQADQTFEKTIVAGQAARFDTKSGIVRIPQKAQGDKPRFVRKISPASGPELIEKVDYSDTWTVNSPTRSGNYVMLQTQKERQVEQCFGNPPREWTFSAPAAATTWPADGSPIPWPGFQVPGSQSGFLESKSSVCFGFEYGLRDDFVVQFDAVQTADRINITIGDDPAGINGKQSLSVFIRASGTPAVSSQPEILPEIGVYSPSLGEADTGLRSGIPTPSQWHNYAVRFNVREKWLAVWTDGRFRGTVKLAAIKAKGENATWADQPWNNHGVGAGAYAYMPHLPLLVWADNFRIGKPAQCLDSGVSAKKNTGDRNGPANERRKAGGKKNGG